MSRKRPRCQVPSPFSCLRCSTTCPANEHSHTEWIVHDAPQQIALRAAPRPQGEVTVAELSERTGVSAMTIRRDLEVLEHEGVLRRVHGGAIGLASRGYAAPYSVRDHARRRGQGGASGRRRRGHARARRETVVLDVGTTTSQVARRRSTSGATSPCSRRACTSPTCWPATAASASWSPAASSTPGELSLVGDMAEEAFSRLRFDTFVMGIGGVDVESGVHRVQPGGRTRQARRAGLRASLHRRRRQQQARQGHLRAGLPARAGRRPGDRQRRGPRGPRRPGSGTRGGGGRLMGRVSELFGERRPLIAMAHLRALPGTPAVRREGRRGRHRREPARRPRDHPRGRLRRGPVLQRGRPAVLVQGRLRAAWRP